MRAPNNTEGLTKLIERGSALAQERREKQLSEDELSEIAGGISQPVTEEASCPTGGTCGAKQPQDPLDYI
jgi:bacteriocin-like protein